MTMRAAGRAIVPPRRVGSQVTSPRDQALAGDGRAEALADALPNAQRRTLEGQTHEVAPEVLAPVLQAFFAS